MENKHRSRSRSLSRPRTGRSSSRSTSEPDIPQILEPDIPQKSANIIGHTSTGAWTGSVYDAADKAASIASPRTSNATPTSATGPTPHLIRVEPDVVAKCVEQPIYDLNVGNITGARSVEDLDPEWRMLDVEENPKKERPTTAKVCGGAVSFSSAVETRAQATGRATQRLERKKVGKEKKSKDKKSKSKDKSKEKKSKSKDNKSSKSSKSTKEKGGGKCKSKKAKKGSSKEGRSRSRSKEKPGKAKSSMEKVGKGRKKADKGSKEKASKKRGSKRHSNEKSSKEKDNKDKQNILPFLSPFRGVHGGRHHLPRPGVSLPLLPLFRVVPQRQHHRPHLHGRLDRERVRRSRRRCQRRQP
nr:serine/threonine-protein kinase PRP4 homolog [Dermacentor andersoni]